MDQHRTDNRTLPLSLDRNALRNWANGADPMPYVRSLRPDDKQIFNASDVIALLDALETTEVERKCQAKLLEALTSELRTLNLILAAQVLQDGEAAEAAARRIRDVVRGGTSHQCMPGMFEDGGA